MPETDSSNTHEIHAYPPGVTFHDLIARNKRNSMLLVLAMAALATVLFVFIAVAVMIYGTGVISWQGIVIAVAAALATVGIASTWSYFGGGNALLRMSGAQPLQKEQDPQLFNVVEELSLAAGTPMPQVWVIDSPALNAFATGRDPEHAAVAITAGLREKLTRDELQGVMAHEMAHIRHYDIRLTMMMATLVGLIVLAADVMLRVTFYGGMRGGGSGGRRSSSGKGGGQGAIMIVLVVLALVLAIVAPLLAKMIQFGISRQREYLADAGAVELTRNPKGLADALRKLTADHTPLPTASRATAHLYIVNPILNAKHKENLASVFSTHPPAQDRIARLESLLR